VANLAKGLVSRQFRVRIYSPGELGVEGCEHSQTLPKPTKGLQQSLIANTPDHLLKIESELRNNCKLGDVIIFNHADHFRYLKKRLGRMFFAKVRCFEIAHWLDAGLYKDIVYPSATLKKCLQKDGFVIPHGEELDFAKHASVRGSHLFYAGRITEDKGVDLAVAASKEIGCRLRIAAPHSNTDFFDSIVREPNVDYLGELAYQELVKEYEEAKAFIYMTQYDEPFGLAVVEAMAAGCPVITTGRGGTGETVLCGETGFFCGTVSDVIEAYSLVETLNFSDIVSRAKKYTVDNMVDGYAALITRGNLPT